MTRLQSTVAELKNRFCELHGRKEDLFWITKMGVAADPLAARRDFAEAEKAVNRFLQEPARLSALREIREQDEAGPDQARLALEGWIATFEANVIDSAEGRRLSDEIVEMEAELERRRTDMELGWVDPETGRLVRASSVKLSLMMRTDPSEARRKAAFEGLRSIETFVLDNGFLDIVRKRNRLGRLLGYEDYYDWRTSVVERLRKREVFARLDDLAARTEATSRANLAAFARQHGEGALEPWNFGHLRAGALTERIDPYFGFAPALERWGRSFHALGVRYRGAVLTLDLVDRPGKYENGFMHAPEVAFFDEGVWQRARINFTANAVPGHPGAGLRATQTLFHEGGHAAHFANILSNAPCFSHEFAPTSVGYAETQSMFMDALLDDADWRVRYALDRDGQGMPMGLIEEAIREEQPFAGWDVRYMLTVSFAERALYELPEDELVPERVLEIFREVERRTQGLTSGVRPVLAVPHLLAGESSAYYHGYVMAEMAVYQTRRFFLARDGHLTDNPRIGPDLARAYWAPGNASSFDDTLVSLTGAGLGADALADACNRSVDQAIEDARRSVARIATVDRPQGPVALDAEIRVMHGRTTVADTREGGFEEACRDFARWIEKLESES